MEILALVLAELWHNVEWLVIRQIAYVLRDTSEIHSHFVAYKITFPLWIDLPHALHHRAEAMLYVKKEITSALVCVLLDTLETRTKGADQNVRLTRIALPIEFVNKTSAKTLVQALVQLMHSVKQYTTHQFALALKDIRETHSKIA